MRIPWLVVGLLVGCLFMRKPHSEFEALGELTICCGGGLIVGLAVDAIAQRWRKRRDGPA